MSNYKYTFSKIDINTIFSGDTLSEKDSVLIDKFEVNSSFNQANDLIEVHYYSLDGRLLDSIPSTPNQQTNQDSETANNGTENTVSLRVTDDLLAKGYNFGDIYLVYNFINNPYTLKQTSLPFFIEEISSDRTEIRILSNVLSNSFLVDITQKIRTNLQSPDSSEYFLNFGENRLLITTNIDTFPYREEESIIIKLYNALPEDITLKTTLNISQKVGNSVGYQAFAELISDIVKPKFLKGPNYSVSVEVDTEQPTQFFNIGELFGYPVTSSFYEVKSAFEEKGAELSIDYSEYSNFINFSSAQERLENFKYKFNLIQTYQSQSDSIVYSNNNQGGITGSRDYYEGLVNNILSNFDHYDRFLYYESSIYSWPKSGVRKPFIPLTGSATGSWYETQLVSASVFDSSNPHSLENTIPEFLREDPNNIKYVKFVHMIGQHFDNLWLYTKAVSDKYDGDNRLDHGISKDLIQDALKNFGVKLYSSNKSTQELFNIFTGNFYEMTSEEFGDRLPFASFITGSEQSTSEENYRKEIYKRLYHNLPLLTKSKGTERGIRALLSTFGVSSFAGNLKETFIVTVGNDSGTNKFKIQGQFAPILRLENNTTYVFDQSDSSNLNHPLEFKYLGSSYTTNVTRTGTPGNPGAKTVLRTTSTTPTTNISGTFLYYCTVHGENMGNSIFTNTISGLTLNQIGGTISGSFNLGGEQFVTSSLERIKIDNTGSIVEGNVLSQYTSIQKSNDKYSKDYNLVEAGFSPANYLNNLIIVSASLDGFDIDDILGDPRLEQSSSYDTLFLKAKEYLAPTTSSAYDLKDFVRILKFYDNVLFKTITDFLPARANVSTGIIIKPHLLERSKVKSPKASFSLHVYTGSISIGEVTGSHGQSYLVGGGEKSTAYSSSAMTPFGPALLSYHTHDEAKYDGELSGSGIVLSTGELNDENPFKYTNPNISFFKLNLSFNCQATVTATDINTSIGTTPTPTATPSVTSFTSPGITTTPSITPTITPSITPTITPSITVSSTSTPIVTSTPSPTPTPSTSVPLYYEFENCNTEEIVYQSNGIPGGITLNDRFEGAGGVRFIYKGNTTTLPGTVVTDLTFIGGTGCFDPTPTPTSSPARIYLGLRNDGTNPWNTSDDACSSGVASIVPENYVEAADYQTPLAIDTIVYAGSTGSTPFDGDDKYWLSEDQTYAYRIGANGVVSQAIECTVPSPTPTPTLTPTPTPSQPFYSFDVWYDSNIGSGDLTTCAQEGTNITVYSTDSSISVTSTVLLSSPDVTDYAPIGWYSYPASSPTISYAIENSSGLVEDSTPCASPTPAPSVTPSSIPCTEIDMQTTGSSTSGAACTGQNSDSRRRHNGTGSSPDMGDTIFSNATCTNTFNGGSNWFFVLQDTIAIQVNASGEVIGRVLC